ncbi:MAG: ABC transporter ATP-binding protein [Armatimonadota bacterium]|nr:ABC transporter ATP-binding protein [Armatimonadota bacterium]
MSERGFAAQAAALVAMRDVHKAFGPVVALDGAHFALPPGEIHGLLGGNGAGKTTLMNILYGLYRADAGTIEVDGRPVEIRAPRDALRYGIGMVHQHFLQVETYTVVENITLGTPVDNPLRTDPARDAARVRDLAGRYGLTVDLLARVADLPVGARQRVEILKALYRGSRVLILDEPTTNLTPQEVDALFGSLRAIVDEGMSVVFITHKIREVRAVCDRISVMRHGRTVLAGAPAGTDDQTLVRAMVGEELDVRTSLLFAGEGRNGRGGGSAGTPVLRVEGLRVLDETGAARVDDCDLRVGAGEILGIAGVAGNGQRELVECFIGLRPAAAGRVWIDHTDVTGADTRSLLDRGVAYIPEDRLHDGFLPDASVADNLILGFHRHPPYSRGALFDPRVAARVARRLIREYGIRTPSHGERAGRLSGGNIQRILLARAFSHPCRLLIAHNPTRGLDIVSTEFVYRKLLDLRAQGAGVLLASEDLDELLLLCDRIAVLYRGRVVGTLPRDRFDRYEIGAMMGGVASVG